MRPPHILATENWSLHKLLTKDFLSEARAPISVLVTTAIFPKNAPPSGRKRTSFPRINHA